MGTSELLDPPTYKMTLLDLPKDSETVKGLCSVQDSHRMAGGNLAPMHLVEPGPPTSSLVDACCLSAGAYQPPSNPPPIIHQGMTSQSALNSPGAGRLVPQVAWGAHEQQHTQLEDKLSAAAAGVHVYRDINVVNNSSGLQT